VRLRGGAVSSAGGLPAEAGLQVQAHPRPITSALVTRSLATPANAATNQIMPSGDPADIAAWPMRPRRLIRGVQPKGGDQPLDRAQENGGGGPAPALWKSRSWAGDRGLRMDRPRPNTAPTGLPETTSKVRALVHSSPVRCALRAVFSYLRGGPRVSAHDWVSTLLTQHQGGLESKGQEEAETAAHGGSPPGHLVRGSTIMQSH